MTVEVEVLLFAAAAACDDVAFPIVLAGGETARVRLDGTVITGSVLNVVGLLLSFASWLRIRSALLGGLSSSLSYATLRRLAAGSESCDCDSVGVGLSGSCEADAC